MIGILDAFSIAIGIKLAMIKEAIQKQILISLKEGKKTELKVLRFILSQINYEEINKQKDLTDEEITTLLQKEVKKRKEAIEIFRKAGRQEMVKDEEEQVEIIKSYLPEQMDDKTLEKIIDEAIKSTGSGMQNMGKIIGLVMSQAKGQADGSQVAKLVREKLQS